MSQETSVAATAKSSRAWLPARLAWGLNRRQDFGYGTPRQHKHPQYKDVIVPDSTRPKKPLVKSPNAKEEGKAAEQQDMTEVGSRLSKTGKQ